MTSSPKTFWASPPTPKWRFQACGDGPTSPSWQFASYSVTTPSKMNGFSSVSSMTPPTTRAMGYLAFPPGGSPYLADDAAIVSSAQKDEEQQAELERQRKEESERQAAWTARVQRDAELRKQQLAKEEAEARRGEEEWVRSGGILRDAQGRRDIVKTQAVRDELKLRDIEKALVEMWDGYERRWKELLAKETVADLRFGDLPWPVDTKVEAGDLTMEKVEEFLLGGLRVRGCNVTRKDRIRSSLLRWHPDKMTGILARVVEEDLELVKEGISVVIRCLQKLNSKV